MNDNDINNVDEIVDDFTENTNLKINSTYINKHILSPYYLTYWRNGLIIDEYEIKEPPKEMTIEEICKELGYEVKIIEKDEK